MVLPSLLMAQGGIRNQGANIKVSSGIQLKVLNGGIMHQDNGTILNEGTIKLTGNWMQDGKNSHYLGAGQLTFIGNTNQQLSSELPLKIATIIVDNGHRLILNNDLHIQQELDLAHNGAVELGTNNLQIGNQALIRNYDESNYIITNGTGSLQQEVNLDAVIFPVGNSTYNPAIIQNQGVSDHFQVHVMDQNSQQEASINRIWQVKEMTKGGSLVHLSLQWDETQELSNFNREASAISTAGINPPLDYSTAVLDGMSWAQSRNSITDLSSFTVTSQDVRPQAKLAHPPTAIRNIELFPNPVQDHLNIQLEGIVGTAFIQVFDAKGSLVLQKNASINQQQIIRLEGVQNLVDGIYSIQITNNKQTTTHQFVNG